MYQIYRLWIVWGRNIKIAALPILLQVTMCGALAGHWQNRPPLTSHSNKRRYYLASLEGLVEYLCNRRRLDHSLFFSHVRVSTTPTRVDDLTQYRVSRTNLICSCELKVVDFREHF